MQDMQSVERTWLSEKAMLFRHLTWVLPALLVATFILMTWVLGRPSSHDENDAVAASKAAAWPDGSKKTPNDWWAKAGEGSPPAVDHNRPESGRPS